MGVPLAFESNNADDEAATAAAGLIVSADAEAEAEAAGLGEAELGGFKSTNLHEHQIKHTYLH